MPEGRTAFLDKIYLARPLAAAKLKDQNVKCKTSEFRQAGITPYYLSNYVSFIEKDTHKKQELDAL